MSNYYRATSSTFTSRQSDRWRRNQNTVAFAPAIKLGPISDINTLDTRLSALNAQKEDLQNENARLQALNTVSNSNVARAMTTPVATEQATN